MFVYNVSIFRPMPKIIHQFYLNDKLTDVYLADGYV